MTTNVIIEISSPKRLNMIPRRKFFSFPHTHTKPEIKMNVQHIVCCQIWIAGRLYHVGDFHTQYTHRIKMKYNHIDNSNAPYPVNKIIPYLFFLHTVILLSNAIIADLNRIDGWLEKLHG